MPQGWTVGPWQYNSPWVWGARDPTASQMATLVKPPSLQVQNIANLMHEQGEFTPCLPQLEQQCTHTAKAAQVNTSKRTAAQLSLNCPSFLTPSSERPVVL